jgi:hypothetical protein
MATATQQQQARTATAPASGVKDAPEKKTYRARGVFGTDSVSVSLIGGKLYLWANRGRSARYGELGVGVRLGDQAALGLANALRSAAKQVSPVDDWHTWGGR